jgi:hypothetical protein
VYSSLIGLFRYLFIIYLLIVNLTQMIDIYRNQYKFFLCKQYIFRVWRYCFKSFCINDIWNWLQYIFISIFLKNPWKYITLLKLKSCLSSFLSERRCDLKKKSDFSKQSRVNCVGALVNQIDVCLLNFIIIKRKCHLG